MENKTVKDGDIRQIERLSDDKKRKPGKSAHGRRGGEDSESSGGSRQGNAGQEGDRGGSFGNR
jgi:hypothetical protein